MWLWHRAGYVAVFSNTRWNYFLCGGTHVDIDVYISLPVSMCVP